MNTATANTDATDRTTRLRWRNTRALWLWAAVIAVTFFAVDSLSLHTGDDLGYLFADSAHHAGDGPRVTTLVQCFTTQNSHYLTTNGRYLVHVMVMTLLNLVPLWVFRALNAFIFSLLWAGILRLIMPAGADKTGASAKLLYAAVWGALLILLPQPGLVLFTLVAYAINYLWTACAIVWLLVALRGVSPALFGDTPASMPPDKLRTAAIMTACTVVGSLQESFSIPVAVALFLSSVMHRLPWRYTLAFIAGTAVVVFAPGNLAHAAQGGGMAAGALAHKAGALGRALMFSAIPFAFLTWSRRNLPWIAAIAFALLFACFTFTSPRQLTCPTLLALVLLLGWLYKALQRVRSPRTIKYVTGGTIAVTAAFLVLVAIVRMPVYIRWQSLLDSMNKNTAIAWPQNNGKCCGIAATDLTTPKNSIKSTLLRAIAPDPLVNRGLVAIGDYYTIQGLSRLRQCTNPEAPKLTGILPATPAEISVTDTLPPFRVLHLPRGTRVQQHYLQQLFDGDTVHVIVY